MYFLYSVLLGLAFMAAAPWWLAAMLRRGKYRASWKERLGLGAKRLIVQVGAHSGGADGLKDCIWVHAVSVGEVLAVAGLVDELRRRFFSWRIVISTTTETGQALARSRYGPGNVFYFPLDFGFAVRPYLRALRPRLVVVAETEFWPNFLRLALAAGARIAVVNARISDRSFPRYRLLRVLTRRILRPISLFLAQSDEDARRLIEIGASAERVQVAGNLKFDIVPPPPAPLVAQLRAALEQSAASPVLVCGSTMEGEERLLLECFGEVQKKYAGALMILAPRHPQRFEEVARLLAAGEHRFWRRSEWNDARHINGGVLLLDSMGELSQVFSLATIALIGGSWKPFGGHNILEPAQFGAPILVGPHMENFRDILAIFQSQDAVRVVELRDLAAAIVELADSPHERAAMGYRARRTLEAHAGATLRTASAISDLYATEGTAGVPFIPVKPARVPE